MFLSPTRIVSSALMVIALVLVGCGDVSQKSKTSANNTSNNTENNLTNNGTNSDPNNTIEVVPGEVTTLASVAKEVAMVGGTAPQAGNTLVLVDVKIGNGLDESLSVGYDKFRLKTDDNLERSASALSAATMPSCPIDALQSAGSVLSCQIAFEIPRGVEPATLIFDAPAGVIESTLRLEACTVCDGRCVDLMTDNAHCGVCSRAVSAEGQCVNGAPGCPSGAFMCHGNCQSSSQRCNIDVEIPKDCFSVCGDAGLTCERANYFYACGDEGISDRDADCRAVPPADCSEYYVNCECGP